MTTTNTELIAEARRQAKRYDKYLHSMSTWGRMREVASARDTCAELGGTFRQWYGVYNDVQWDCQFDEVSDD